MGLCWGQPGVLMMLGACQALGISFILKDSKLGRKILPTQAVRLIRPSAPASHMHLVAHSSASHCRRTLPCSFSPAPLPQHCPTFANYHGKPLPLCLPSPSSHLPRPCPAMYSQCEFHTPSPGPALPYHCRLPRQRPVRGEAAAGGRAHRLPLAGQGRQRGRGQGHEARDRTV